MLTPAKITEEFHIPLASQAPRPRRFSPALLLAVTLVVLIIQFGRYCAANVNSGIVSGEAIPVKSTADLPRFSRVQPYLYRGGAPTEEGLKQLKAMGVKTIIDLRTTADKILWERTKCAELGMKYVSLPTGNFFPAKSAEQTFLSEVDAAADNGDKAPVFIHCSHGSDRTSYAVAVWRMKREGWNIADAVSEMFQHGFLIHRFGK